MNHELANSLACHGQTTVLCQSRSRASSCHSSGCLSCTQTSSEGSKEASEIDRSPGEASKHLMWLEDDRVPAKRLEKVLRSWGFMLTLKKETTSLNSTGERA
jgi:hypothetical protein